MQEILPRTGPAAFSQSLHRSSRNAPVSNLRSIMTVIALFVPVAQAAVVSPTPPEDDPLSGFLGRIGGIGACVIIVSL